MAKQKSLVKNALFNFIKCFSNIVFPIISFPYASRILLKDGIGTVNFANNIIEYFILIAGLGIASYAAREGAKIRDDKYLFTKFVREILFFNVLTTFFAYILFFLSFIFLHQFQEYKVLLIISATKILFTSIGLEWLFYAKEEYGYITLRHTLFQIASLFLLFTLVKANDPYNYLKYAGVGIFSSVGANIFNLIYSRKFVNVFEKTPIELSKHVKPILTFFGLRCADKINGLIDTTMLGFMSGKASVGLYTAATKLSKMVRELITAVISTFMPRTSYLLANKDNATYEKLINKVFAVTLFFSIPAAIGLFLLAEPLTILFCGEDFIESIPTMKLLAFCIIFMSLNSYFNNLILTPNRLEKFMLIAQLISLSVNLCLNWFFIKKWGVYGAGIATLLVEFILPLVKIVPCWKYIKNKSIFIDFIKIVIGTVFMFLVIFLLFNMIENYWNRIWISIVIGTIIYEFIEILLKQSTAMMIVEMIKNKVCTKKKKNIK